MSVFLRGAKEKASERDSREEEKEKEGCTEGEGGGERAEKHETGNTHTHTPPFSSFFLFFSLCCRRLPKREGLGGLRVSTGDRRPAYLHI